MIHRNYSRKFIFEQLEPRLLLSADLDPTALAGVVVHDPIEFVSTVVETSPDAGIFENNGGVAQQRNSEIFFVDANIPDHEVLIADLLASLGSGRQAEIITLDGDLDGIEQISEILAQRQGIDGVHIVSHGTEGALKLGSTWLTADNINMYADAIAGWQDGLSSKADLLFYGCDLAAGEDGLALLEGFSSLTGADVAASDNPTGSAGCGGDWILEYADGAIQSDAAFSAFAHPEWQGLLAPFVVTSTLDDGSVGTLRWAITEANLTPAADLITFNLPDNGPGHFYYQDDGGPGLTVIAPTLVDDGSISDFDPDYPYAQHSWFVIDIDPLLPQLEITRTVVIDGYSQPGASANTLADASNAIIRIELTASDPADGLDGLLITGNDVVVRGLAVNDFQDNGIDVDGASDTILQGNFIGTDITGTVARANGAQGIMLQSNPRNATVGSAQLEDRNLISANAGPGIEVNGNASTQNIIIQGNLVGTDATATQNLGNAGSGIVFSGSPKNSFVGGITAGEANIIAYNSGFGVELQGGDDIAIRSNSIYSNSNNGIEINIANNSQPAPLLTNVANSGGPPTLVYGTYSSPANFGLVIDLDFYYSPVDTPLEGKTYLGTQQITLDAAGAADIIASFGIDSALLSGQYITVTATDPDGKTSNFSNAVPVMITVNNPPTTTGLADVIVDEDAADTVIDLAGAFSDVEDVFLTYTITANTGTGLMTSAVAGSSLTLDYVADQFGIADITVRATDAGSLFVEDTFRVTVNPANDPPTVATNTGVTVSEGSTGTVISSTMLNEGDPDDTGTGLTYTVTTVPVNGILKLSGTALVNGNTFTQDDIDNSRITYDHDGSDTTGDSFIFDLADGGEDGATAVTSQTFAITVTPINDPPTVATNTGVTVSEGSTGTVISSTMLNEGDPDDSGTGLTYTVTSIPVNGTLKLSGTNLVNGNTFTQDDIDNSRITYDHDGSETTGDSFVFDLADGGEDGTAAVTSQTFDITVTPVNDPPTVATNTGVTVSEGSTGTVISSTMLNEGDPDDSSIGLTYTVTTVPVNGTLKLSGTALVNGNTFTQDDIDNSRITYDHDGSPTSSDSFVFYLADGGEDGAAAVTGQTFDITVTPFNNPPTVAVNTGVTVAEGSIGTVISSTMLNEGDLDDSGTGLTYTVITIPNNGALKLSGTPLANGNTFTQDDIDNSRITYDHDGSETNGDSFAFDLADGGEDGAAAVTGQTFAITVTPVNDPPTTSSLANVTVNENAPDTIIDLSSAFADVEDATLTYTVTANTNSGLVTTAVAGSSLTLDYVVNQSGTANITVRATDSGGLFVEDTFRVGVTPVTNAPITTGLPDIKVNEEAPDTVIDLSTAFRDVDDAKLTYTITANTNSSLVTTAVAGSILTLDYAADQFGAADITVRATDSDRLFVEDTFRVTVIPVNDAPTTTGLGDVTVNEDAPDTLINLSSAFADVDAAGVFANADDSALFADIRGGEKLTYMVTANSNSGLITTSVAGSSLTIGYGADQFGTADITVRATDSGGLFVEDTFTVTVNPVNDTPTTTGLSDRTVDENAPDTIINLSTAFADVEDATLSYTVTANSDSGLVTTSLAGSNLTLDYAADQFGTADITVRATDSGGQFVEDTFRVTVTEVDNTPTTTGLADVTVDENGPDTVIDLSSAFSDVEDETLIYTVTANTDSGLVTVSVDGSSLTLDYVADQFGTANITVRATDSGGLFVEDTFRVTIVETRINPNEISNETPKTTPDSETDITTADDTDTTRDEDSTEPEGEDTTQPEAEETDPSADETLNPQDAGDFNETDGGQEQTEAASPLQLGLNPVGISFKPVEITSINLDFYTENQAAGQISGTSMLRGSSPTAKNYYRREIDWGVDYKMTSLLLQHSFDALEKETAREIKLEKTVIGSAIAATTTFSVGYVVWVIRSGMLLSSLLSSLPAWQIADPLPILARLKDEEDEEDGDDESIEEIIGDDTTEQEAENKDDKKKDRPEVSG